jgi:hypothetical protein
LAAENFNWFFGGWRLQARRLAGLWATAFSWFVYLLTLLAAYALARHALLFHRDLTSRGVGWPSPEELRWRAGKLWAAGQASWRQRGRVVELLEVPVTTARQTLWPAAWRGELSAVVDWWKALDAPARRALGRVAVTDAALALFILRLVGMW